MIYNNSREKGEPNPYLTQSPFQGTKALKRCSLKGDIEVRVDPPMRTSPAAGEKCADMYMQLLDRDTQQRWEQSRSLSGPKDAITLVWPVDDVPSQ